MGACGCKAHGASEVERVPAGATAVSVKATIDKAKREPPLLSTNDPRWDIAGFSAWCESAEIAWVRATYLRRLVREERLLPKRQEIPPEWLHVGAPPVDVQLFVVSYTWATKEHPDPTGVMIGRVAAVLDLEGALDSALVFLDWASIFQAPRAEREQELFKRQLHELNRLYTFFRCKCIVDDNEREDGTHYFERGWPLFEFSLSSYAQQILPRDHREVRAHLTPEWLMDWEKLVLDSSVHMTNLSDKKVLVHLREKWGERMTPASTDAAGFQIACHQANYCWVLVSFVHELAARGGPAPRRQDLPPGTHVDGAVPAGRQPWVVSYGWSAVFHFSPSGEKLRELSRVLEELKAKPSDVVFLDYMSMWQAGHEVPAVYASQNKSARVKETAADGSKVLQPGLTVEQEVERDFALSETTRLYAFRGGALPNGEVVLGCKVLVLPKIEDPHSFPYPGEIKMERNTHCNPPREELRSSWGFVKSIPYERGGWTCTEYTVARFNGTIANAHHEDVQRVERAGPWPRSVYEFAGMMDEGAEKPVAFTKKGDRDAVRFNFFKFSYHILSRG